MIYYYYIYKLHVENLCVRREERPGTSHATHHWSHEPHGSRDQISTLPYFFEQQYTTGQNCVMKLICLIFF